MSGCYATPNIGTYHAVHATGAARSMGVVEKRDLVRREVNVVQLSAASGHVKEVLETCQVIIPLRDIANAQQTQMAARAVDVATLVQ